VKLGLQLGYWQAGPPLDALELLIEAEELGYDVAFTAEAWGSDAFSPLAWWGASTSRIKLGTAIAQMSARTPTSTAMTVLTMDHLSGGRMVLGLGLSGPQVVEGWYGKPFSKPLAQSREFVNIVRRVLARDVPVTSVGPHFPLPYRGSGAVNLGKPLMSIVHPLRSDVPILMGAGGPKNVALAAEIADGWLPMSYSPRVAKMYRSWLDEGFARLGARQTAATFDIAPFCEVIVTENRDQALEAMKPTLGFYIGGMGAKESNFHKDGIARMGYEREVTEIQDLFLDGKQEEAIAAVPTQMIADMSLVGSREQIRDELPMWEEAGVTCLVVSARSIEDLRKIADVILDS
jgi:F420-dependent oxidoreductase-like protein